MYKSHFFLFVLIHFFFISALQLKAQGNSTTAAKKSTARDSTSSDTTDSKRSLTIEMDAGTSRGYEARRRTATPASKQKYFEPNINYEANSGFFASVAAYNTPGVKRSWDELDLGLGYDFTISKSADIDGSIGYTHFSFSQALKKSGVNPESNDFIAYIKHDFDIVALKLTGDYYFGDTIKDEDLMLDIDHDFEFENILSKKGELSIDPDLTFIGGTLNYYKGIIPLPPPVPPNAPPKEIESYNKKIADISGFSYSKFNMIDIEFALPLNYQIGKFDFEIAWRYTKPTNLPSELNAKAFGYVTGYISYDFFK